MSRILKSTLLFFILIGLFSCKDDDTVTIYVVPYAEQEPVDNAAIVEFLTNNYFNEEEFIAPVVNFSYDIEFSTDQMAGSYTRTPLINYVNTVINNFTIETKTIIVSDVDHTLYILKIVQGLGAEQPRFCDEALLSYEGMTLGKDVFDNALNPVKLDLSGTVKGFSESVSEFNIADNVGIVGDGTFDYQNFGVGAVFMPSGLGYYASPVGSIAVYSPLIFKLKVYGATELDHDSDGVPTYIEDLNSDHDLNNDDSDLDGVPNYVDTNDDNDPILTINEDIDEDGDPTNDDTDGDGIPNYLDSDS
ncbi:MAG: hypothetical protein COA88_03300 [Kordia sp.]|nr:MAG: hypothetical protein COA88_03300 [Kordia sp.]